MYFSIFGNQTGIFSVHGDVNVREIISGASGNGEGIFGRKQDRSAEQGMRTDGHDRENGRGWIDKGPPAEKEYAVEPVGVATMMPSAR